MPPPSKRAHLRKRAEPTPSVAVLSAAVAAAASTFAPGRVNLNLPPLYSSDSNDSLSEAEDSDTEESVTAESDSARPRWSREWQLLEQQLDVFSQIESEHSVLCIKGYETAVPRSPPDSDMEDEEETRPSHSSVEAAAAAAAAAGLASRFPPTKLHVSPFVILDSLANLSEQVWMGPQMLEQVLEQGDSRRILGESLFPTFSLAAPPLVVTSVTPTRTVVLTKLQPSEPRRRVPIPTAGAAAAASTSSSAAAPSAHTSSSRNRTVSPPLPPRQSHHRAARDATFGLYNVEAQGAATTEDVGMEDDALSDAAVASSLLRSSPPAPA